MCERNLYLRHLCKISVRQIRGHFMTDKLELSVAKLRHYKDLFLHVPAMIGFFGLKHNHFLQMPEDFIRAACHQGTGTCNELF